MSVLRTGKLARGRREELCLIRNISASGLMAHVYSPLDIGEPVAIELKSTYVASGKVVWCHDLMAGVEFDGLIDTAGLLAGHQEEGGAGLSSRLPRLQVEDEAGLYIDGIDHRVRLHNISQGGARIAAPEVAKVNDKLIVTIDGLPALPGVLVWRKRDEGGIAFVPQIPFEVLARWAANRGAEETACG
jgi:hypothetical protein